MTVLIALLVPAMVGATNAHAERTFGAVYWNDSDASYVRAMPTFDDHGGQLEVQPGNPSKTRADITYIPTENKGSQLKLEAYYSGGLGYYSLTVGCLFTPSPYWQYDYTIISGFGYIPDYQRPFVGAFYQPDGNLVLYKYNKDSAGNRTDSWVIGALGTQPGGTTAFNQRGTFQRGTYVRGLPNGGGPLNPPGLNCW